MMYLTTEEERMLSGEYGDITARCMAYLVKYGDVAGAERLVDIVYADLHPTPSAFDASLGLNLNDPALDGQRVKVPTFSNKVVGSSFCLDGWEDMFPPHNDPAFHRQHLTGLDPYWRLGVVPTCSCDFYLVASYLPTVGQHCSNCESSVIPWINAIQGARTNMDGGFAPAYVGKIPAYDMHLDENRVATRRVKCEAALRTDMDYDLFGWAVGEAMTLNVPVMTGLGRPTTSQIVKMNASLNTAGQVRMYHVPGLTPEASSVEAALDGQRPVETLTVDRAALKGVYDLLTYASTERVDFVYLGCPHYNIAELQTVAYLLEGQRCKAPLWITTNPITFKTAEAMGLRAIITRAGGVLLSGSCPGLMDGFMPPNTEVMATDAAKINYYITGFVYPRKLEVWYGSTKDCIEAAVTGTWRGRWPRGD